MQWSKLRSRVRGLICPELRKRIDFHVNSYRKSHDEAEKVWVTIDGECVLTASWYRHQWYGWTRDDRGRLTGAGTYSGPAAKFEDEVHLPSEIGGALRAYLDLPIREALDSEDPFIRALSLVDRRVGKRTIEALQIDEDDHSLVKAFYVLRMSAAGAPVGRD